MKTIKFSENELEFLRNHYELELIDAENYIAEIKSILKKFGVVQKAEAPEKPKKKRGRPKKVKTEPQTPKETVKAVAASKITAPKKTAPAKKKAAPKTKTPAKKTAPKKTVKPVEAVAPSAAGV